MNKEQLLVEIDNLPLFKLRDVAVKETNVVTDKDGNVLNPDELKEDWIEHEQSKAVTEMNKTEPYAFVSSDYQLVQFNEMFKPIVEKMEGIHGDLEHWKGFAIMDIFPENEEYKMGNGAIGIVAYNSVDTKSALNIRFCVKYGKRKLTIPKGVASYRKVHVGSIKTMTQDYITVITKIKESWQTILNKFIDYEVKEDDLPSIAENFKIDERAMKFMRKKMKAGATFNMWDFVMAVFDYLSQRHYKSEVHRRKRIDKFVQAIFDYGLVMEL